MSAERQKEVVARQARLATSYQRIVRMPVEQRCPAVFEMFAQDKTYTGWDGRYMSEGVKFVSCSPDGQNVTFELIIDASLCQQQGVMHGGAASSILDNLTSVPLLLIAKPGFLDGGNVSRTLTLTYLRPVTEGMKVRVEAEVMSVGKTMANTRGVMKDKKGRVCVECTHDKVILPSPLAKL